MKNLEKMGVQEMNSGDQSASNGGFFPLVILGVYISSKVMAGIIIGTFAVGTVAGVAIAASE
ncbi:MAG: hypothetical protein COW03_02565 [Cytophagales bacterium CG12_big_fil_rev_8_21_14_0_65_40_12]|nr:MAG: hypothetical protein COW03_02565 [Cytophagales bacterium CG12_big_fil_rev_8_21_14_0_65_40_12]PIW03426.1 MAG: hypothetical protein COW40_14810 [Cytophagales bacterium CG17_big_fil_post_rev_8_21_14_2_50_40_13]